MRPDLSIRTDVYDPHAAAERVLFVIQRLAGSPSRAERHEARRARAQARAGGGRRGRLPGHLRAAAPAPRVPRDRGRRRGRDGVAAVVRERPDLVISDLRLPDGSGLDVVRAARSMPEPPSVIVVTGYPSAETRQAALAAGATTFLAKPFAAAGLLARRPLEPPRRRQHGDRDMIEPIRDHWIIVLGIVVLVGALVVWWRNRR